jgi:hypothetical protein
MLLATGVYRGIFIKLKEIFARIKQVSLICRTFCSSG